MLNHSRAILMMIVFLGGGLAGSKWAVSTTTGYHFGFVLLAFVSAYVALLVTYACYRRTIQRFRSASSRKAESKQMREHLTSIVRLLRDNG